MASTILLMTRGDTFTYTATIGAPVVNLTGYTLWFTVKPAINLATDTTDTSALVSNYWVQGGASLGITVATPSTGVAIVTVAPAITATFDARRSYLWDLQMKDAATAITTIDSGSITVTDDLTIRITTP